MQVKKFSNTSGVSELPTKFSQYSASIMTPSADVSSLQFFCWMKKIKYLHEATNNTGIRFVI